SFPYSCSLRPPPAVPLVLFFFSMIRRPPRSTLFPTRRSSDLAYPRQSRFPPAGTVRPADPHRQRHGAGRSARPSARTRSAGAVRDRKSTRLNSSHVKISYAVFCLKKKKKQRANGAQPNKHHER